MNNNFLPYLKKTGCKLTTPRKEILRTLSHHVPQSAQEISTILKQKGFNIDLVTVYRTLELFQTIGIANKIQFEDKTARYELASDKNHHHHLVCVKCQKIAKFKADETAFLNKIRRSTNFQTIRHSLEFFGLCERCQKP